MGRSAYRWLERSVLASVLLGQVLLFWQDQLAAVVQLGWSLLLLAALRYAIRQEDSATHAGDRRRRRSEGHARNRSSAVTRRSASCA